MNLMPVALPDLNPLSRSLGHAISCGPTCRLHVKMAQEQTIRKRIHASSDDVGVADQNA